MDGMSEHQAYTTERTASLKATGRLCALLVMAALALASCGLFRPGNGRSTDKDGGAKDETPRAHAPRHKPADHRVLVMVGPSFAGRPELLSPVVEEYGVLDDAIPESPGMMTVMTWPDSFIVEKRPRLSKLTEAAEDPRVTIVATLGAPEGTVRELNRLRSSRPDLKILSLFGEDAALQLEAVSDLVLDRTSPKGILEDENATPGALLSDEAAGVLLLGALLSAEDRDQSTAPLVKLSVSLDAARSYARNRHFGSDWTVSAFVDPDTGLKSRNHLVVDIPQTAPAPSGAQSTAAPVAGGDGGQS
jgi:hypothetical protein